MRALEEEAPSWAGHIPREPQIMNKRRANSPILLKPPHSDAIPDLELRIRLRLTPQLGDQPDALVAETHGRVAVVFIGAAHAAVGDRDDGFGGARGAGSGGRGDGAGGGAFEDREGGCGHFGEGEGRVGKGEGLVRRQGEETGRLASRWKCSDGETKDENSGCI